MKTKEIVMQTLSGSIMVLVGVLGIYVVSKTMDSPPPPVIKKEISSCEIALDKFSALYRATSKIGAIPYNSDFADCYDQSKLLVKVLAEENIKSSIIINEDRSHSYVVVWIEATSGQFVPVDVESGILEIRNGSNIQDVQCYNNRL